MKSGLIFDIRRFCVHDGPGIRTTIFFKGCPLRCIWCHNPESINPNHETLPQALKLGQETIIREQTIGKEMSLEEVLKEVLVDKAFFEQSQGGVTLSGGEPLMQAAFAVNLLKNLHQLGIHTALDTSGYAPQQTFLDTLPFTSLFLFDLKHLRNSKHTELTGQSNVLILKNLSLLLNHNASVIIRFPLMPGLNDDEDNLSALRTLLQRHSQIKELHILPFHRTANAKYKALGLPVPPDTLTPPPASRLVEIADYLKNSNLIIKTGG